MRIFIIIPLILFSILTTSCTSAPMVALMGYDTLNKRDRWHEYAKQKDPYAQYELAESYCCRPYEGKTSNKEALKWWCIAAQNGHAKAQLKLGKLYEHQEQLEGVEIQRDIMKAYMWYTLSQRRGNEEAREAYHRLKDTMDPKVIRKVDTMLTRWKTDECGK